MVNPRWRPELANSRIPDGKHNKKNRVNLNAGGYIGSSIKSEYDGKILSNKSHEKYYKGMI